MAGIFPHASAAAGNFQPGTQVRWFISEREISPYVGRVSGVLPAINKIDVEWPVGGNQRMDPTELIVVTPFAGVAPVVEDTGYSSYDKEISKKNYGTLTQNLRRLAQKLAFQTDTPPSKKNDIRKMAKKLATQFTSNVVTKLADDVLLGVKRGLTDVQIYQALYPRYASVCSDVFLRSAVTEVCKTAGNIGLPDPKKYKDFNTYVKDLKAWLGVEDLDPKRIEEEKKRFKESQ